MKKNYKGGTVMITARELRTKAEQGDVNARNELETMANQGNSEAQYLMSFVARDKRAYWVEKAASNGYAEAQWCLGDMYDYGDDGLPESPEKAVEWFTKSANQGYGLGQYNLGECYYMGRGFEKSQSRGVELFEQASKNGVGLASFRLGLHYGDDSGRLTGESKKWFTIANEQGDSTSKVYLACDLWMEYNVQIGDGAPPNVELLKEARNYLNSALEGRLKNQHKEWAQEILSKVEQKL
jgi:TPR repeat protein